MKALSLSAIAGAAVIAAGMLGVSASATLAYDGQKCKAPGVCWEPKPGFPEKVAGSKYDPKHDPKEVAKQGISRQGEEERNAKRSANFIKTGRWVYDVSKIR